MTAIPAHTVQAEHWNGPEGRHWAAHHDRYGAMLAPFGDRVLQAAAIRPRERVLDIGCGAGDLSLAAGRTVGGDGHVVGVDVSVPLIEAASQRAAIEHLGNVSFALGDAQTYAFEPATFDAAISRFGVMFFGDPRAAFTNIGQALRPGGRLSFVCWQDATVNEWMLVPSMAALAHVPPPDPAAFEALSPFEFADTTRVTDILTEAGFVDVACTPVEHPLLFGGTGSLEDAVEFFRDGGFGTALLADADPTQIEHALAAVTEAFTPLLTSQGVALGASAWLVTASTPWSCLLT